jgi:hypothetical protein
MNVLFASYSWNASPVDGTDIIRSFAAKARTFRFPLELQEDIHRVTRIPPAEGEHAIQHVETMFPMWYQQKELLKLLNEERRTRHRNMKNKARKKRQFNPGDLVIVRKQVQSKASEGRPEKLVLKAKGPYQVLESAGPGSYWLQKLPVLQGLNRRKGKKVKEAAMRMERIPSTVVIHKRLDSLDTRFAKMDQDLVNNPLEQNLGFFDFGKYHKAAANTDYAFVRVNEMWDEPLDPDTSDDEDTHPTDQDEDTTHTEPDNATTNIPPAQNPDIPPAQSPKRTQPRRNTRQTVTIIAPKTRSQELTELWNKTNTSKDKLFFIRRHETGRDLAEWHLVQVDADEMNTAKAKRHGEYHVRYYIRHQADSQKKKTRECKFWPLLRELQTDGYLGPIIQVRPSRVDHFLNENPASYVWYQDTINLADTMITGPFNFTTNNIIAPTDWTQLLEHAEDFRVDATNVNKRDPLPIHKRNRPRR